MYSQTLVGRRASGSSASCSGRLQAAFDAHRPFFHRSAPHVRMRGRRTSASAERNYYQVLEVERGADVKAIKKAFKKKALRYHPDVNKEPDAKEQFMECKTAYQTLADTEQRRKYDRTLDGGSAGFDWNSFGDAFKQAQSGSSRRQTSQRQEEEFYGFDAFFKDLEKDFQDQQARQTGPPKSLWQELYDVGEEFVEFLEQEVSSIEKRSQKKTRSKSEETSNATREDAERAGEQARLSAEEQARSAKKAAEDAKLKAEQEIDDMLASLKRGTDSQR